MIRRARHTWGLNNIQLPRPQMRKEKVRMADVPAVPNSVRLGHSEEKLPPGGVGHSGPRRWQLCSVDSSVN